MVGWRKRIGRMGNHYANEAGLNHTVPMIICWEEPRLLGSLVCSTAGTHFLCFLSHSSSLFPILQFSHLFSPRSPLKFRLLCVCAFGFGVTGVDTARTFRYRPSVCTYSKMWIIAVQPFSFWITAHNILSAVNLFYHITHVSLDQ